VGHLRNEKDPLTAVRAWTRIPRHLPITLTLIGRELDPALAHKVGALVRRDPRIRWEGEKTHVGTLDFIRRAGVLVNSSRMEGGAHVIAEAILGGTPVLASRMPGNLGMLGDRYDGYFRAGNAQALARTLIRFFRDRRYATTLARQCRERRALFAMAREKRAVRSLVARLLREHRMP
jgi:glycosyltransferase involved in cell wall biosynthesis